MAAASAPEASAKTRALYARILDQFGEMKQKLAGPSDAVAKLRPAVSAWSVQQHVDHLGAVDQMLVMAIERALAAPPAPDAKLGLTARIVLLTGYIPRGKAKAPEIAIPKAPTAEEAAKNVERALKCVQALEKKLGAIEAGQGVAPHPALGNFRPGQWLKFIEIHHKHHFKIIRDIEKAA